MSTPTFTKGVGLVRLADGRTVHVHHGESLPSDTIPEEIARLDKAGSLSWPGDNEDSGATPDPAVPADEAGGNPSGLDEDAAALHEWLEKEAPNAGDTLAVAENDPARAAALLAAEGARAKPRKGVVTELQAMLDGADTPTT